jgi:hypothetical protein
MNCDYRLLWGDAESSRETRLRASGAVGKKERPDFGAMFSGFRADRVMTQFPTSDR